MRLLVAGGREYADRDHVRSVLDVIDVYAGIFCLVHGGASGADSLANEWAFDRGVLAEVYPVSQREWREHGKAAGPMRNARMLKEGRPDYAVLFPGGRGTSDMRSQLISNGVGLIDTALELDQWPEAIQRHFHRG